MASALQHKRATSAPEIITVNLRDYAVNRYGAVDDYPFGGGPGMILRPDVLERALLEGVVAAGGYPGLSALHVVYPGPAGVLWQRDRCLAFAHQFWPSSDDGGDRVSVLDLVFVCGRYEGVDQRFVDKYVQEEISVGDFVISGGELAVLVILDSALRFLPGVLGNALGAAHESFEDALLEAPQYTRPQQFGELAVPALLLSGHHEKIKTYQREQQLTITAQKRPDLWQQWQRRRR